MIHRFISEFGGGLGDVITLIHWSDRYNRLSELQEGERALIVLMSHNPHAKEIFLWHPKASRFDIRDLGFWWPWEDVQKRSVYGLGPAQPLVLKKQEKVEFYPSPEDRAFLETLDSFPYIVISAGAGGNDRNLPRPVYEDIAQAICEKGHREYGFRAVIIGRTYNSQARQEPQFIPRGSLINAVDRLSVPGMIELLARSSGVVCCFSAVCLAAWYLAKPVFLAYPTDVRDREFFKPAHQYTFGKDFPTTMHLTFHSYARKEINTFIEMAELVRKGLFLRNVR